MNNTKHQKEVYIGTTGRNLKQRLKEHIEDIRKGKLTTALARRVYEHDIDVDWQEAKVIKSVCNMKELKVAEELAIFQGSKIEK